MSRFKVFLRVVGTVSADAEADSPEEAAEKVCDMIHDERDSKFLPLYMDDIETFVPVAYNGESGDTRDLDVPKEIVEQEVSNALVGSKLYALVKIERDERGVYHRPEVSLFLSEQRAHQKMALEYDMALRRIGFPYKCSERPDGRYFCCWVESCKYNSETIWYVREANLDMKKTGG